MRASVRTLCCGVALATLAALACAPEQVRYERTLEESPPAEVHAVHDVRLRQIMRRLDRLQTARLPRGFEVDREKRERRRELAAVLEAMADSAGSLSDAASMEDLPPTEREAFRDLARTLGLRCRALAAEVEDLPPDALNARLDGIGSVCQDCHARFRLPMPEP